MIIYTSDTCAPCKALKRVLDNKGIKYDERNTSNVEHLKELNELGYSSTPVTVIGENVIVGGDIQAILSLVGE